MNKNKKKKLLIIGSVLLTLVLIIGVVIFIMVKNFNKQLEALNYQEVDMTAVADGIYTGVSETSMVKATVKVTVTDHKITDLIILNHDNGRGKDAEAIIDDIVAKNSCDVDAVSGATASSKVIKSAVRNALIQGISK